LTTTLIVVIVGMMLALTLYFYKFSTAVWAIWLVPFISGLAVAMLA